MKKLYFIFSISLTPFFTSAQETHFEKTNGTETADYFQIIEWYQKMDAASDLVQLKTMGPTDAGFPLHVLLVSADKLFNPAVWHQQKKIVLMINNGIHPGEPDGIDASMLLVKDIVQGKINLPQNVALAFIPVYNIGGCLNRQSHTRVNQDGPKLYGFRGNAQNLDLNRDFTKADSKEAASFAGIFHFLDPHIFIDNHVSDGADFQHSMTLISTQYEKLGLGLGKYLKQHFEPGIYKKMAKKEWDLIPYVDFENSDFTKGISMFYDPPRYSTGYAAMFQTLAFMPETHMLKPYSQRVKSTYDLMVCFMQQAAQDAEEIYRLKQNARAELIHQKKFPLKWRKDALIHDEIIFKGYATDSAKSKATGLMAMYYNRNKPYTAKIPFYNFFHGENAVSAPRAYLIPQGWHEVIERLKQNNVLMHALHQDTLIAVSVYRIEDYKSYSKAYEQHHKNYAVRVSQKTVSEKFRKGDYLIFTNQPAKRYLVEMLEPEAEDGFFSWNFFDAILQQKEGYSDYRWDELAAKWLSENPDLQNKLAEKKRLDPKFALDHKAILAYLYTNSPYAEKGYREYPVYRVEY